MQQSQFDFDPMKEPEVPTQAEPKVFSVSELNKLIRGQLESEFNTIWIQAEISNFKAHSSGHHYFSLKDSKCQVNAVMFRGFNQKLKFKPHDGLEVLVRGKVTVYEPRGNYQVFCEMMEPVGAGALQKSFEQLKAKLKSEGLFEKNLKRPLPEFPKHVGVVTSPTGAAIRDIINVLTRRQKGLKVTVIPAMVQGEQAPGSILKALSLAEKLKDLDVLIVGRGGGSMEDLWAFNDEGVVRKIRSFPVPVISAVGHEVDFTIADFVADLRAPTPSAGAELVVKSSAELLERIDRLSKNLFSQIRSRIEFQKQKWLQVRRALVDPRKSLQDSQQKCDELEQRLNQAVLRTLKDQEQGLNRLSKRLVPPSRQFAEFRKTLEQSLLRIQVSLRALVQTKKSQLSEAAGVLDSLSPLKVLNRGFAVVSKDKKVLRSEKDLKPEDELTLHWSEGEARVRVIETQSKIFEGL